MDIEDQLVAEMKSRGPQHNVSTFAFTATPKEKTLELFGHRDERGRYAPFSLYSMRQDDPTYERDKAHRLLRAFVELHDHAIGEKVRIMVEHFHQNVAHRINGRAKAMIVTRSRLHAIRYHRALERYVTEQGYDYGALVAFSGTVRDGDMDYTSGPSPRFGEHRERGCAPPARRADAGIASLFRGGATQQGARRRARMPSTSRGRSAGTTTSSATRRRRRSPRPTSPSGPRSGPGGTASPTSPRSTGSSTP
jgi:type I restriction enzyme, R subunit